MEQVRFITAIVLCFILYLVWAYFFVPKKPTPPMSKAAIEAKTGVTADSAAKAATATGAAVAVTNTASLAAAPAAGAITATAAAPALPSREITVETPLYIASFTEKGGALASFTLKKYKETIKPDSAFKSMTNLPEGSLDLATKFENGSVPELASATFTSKAPDKIDATKGPASFSMTWVSPAGVTVEKRYTFHPGTYLMDLDINVVNGSGQPVSDRLSVELKSIMGKPTNYGFEGPLALVQGALEEVKTPKLLKSGPASKTGKIFWSGITDRYFLSVVAPTVPEDGEATFSAEAAKDKRSIVTSRYIAPKADIPLGATRKYSYKIYMGPKSTEALQAAGDKFYRALSFGIWSFIAKPLLYLMDFVYKFIPNYGIAIMLITFFIKLLFWPLSNKSYKSMSAMKKLTPLMNEIREKYKDDKKRMNEEVFALYRTYKVNPMSGCLPILLQIPVFFALWRMLSGAIELRHAPFYGWIMDLSAPDRLMPSLHVPFVEPSGIPVLTLVMGVTMFIQQKMSPPPGDPTQARIMMLLPIIFTFIFINLPAGLVLYWLVNNVLSIGQQYYIQKKYA